MDNTFLSDARQLEVMHFPFPSLDTSTFLIAKCFYSYKDDFLKKKNRQNQCLYKDAKSLLLVDMRRRLKNDNTVRMRTQKIKEKRATEDFPGW